MFIGRHHEHLELEEVERIPDHLPTPGDVRVRATVKLQDFGGSYAGVWLARSELSKFVDQLRTVVETRRGTATLEAMSPGEFTIELRSLDSAGHFEVRVRVGRHQYSGRTNWPTMVAGGFEVEPDQLPSVLAAFESLLSPAQAS